LSTVFDNKQPFTPSKRYNQTAIDMNK